MDFLAIINAIAQTVQFQVLVGLVFLDVILGIAAALRTGEFNWAELAGWFRGMVVPYLLGYIGLVIAVNFILPADVTSLPAIAEAGLAEWLNVAAVNFAWLTLVGTLGQKIIKNGRLLYGGK